MLATSEKTRLEQFSEWLWAIPRHAVPRVDSGHLWLDGLFIILLCSLQYTVLPDLLSGHHVIDLITPWLVLNIIVQSSWRATTLAVFSGLIQETHSSFPAGTYIAAYWIVANATALVKPALSWRHTVPWLVTLVLALTWVRLFELFIILMTRHGLVLEARLLLNQLATIVIGTLLGLRLAKRHAKEFALKDTRQ